MRRTLLALALGGALLMAGSVAPAVNPPTKQGGEARLRQGVVQASPVATADTVYVRIQDGTEVFPLPYPAGYVPLAGDVVQVLSIGAGSTETATVLYPVAGRSGNRVLNSAFVLGDFDFVGLPPYWTHYRAAGPTDITVSGTISGDSVHTVLLFSGSTTLASDNYAYSAPIRVAQGEQHELSATLEVRAADPQITISLLAQWYTGPAGVYPDDIVSADTLASGQTIGTGNGALVGTVTVPTDVSYMRVAVRIQQGVGSGVGYDAFWRAVLAYRVA